MNDNTMTQTASPAQIEANRRNALQSTGPRTPQGKAASRMNALKHGIRSQQVVVRGRCIREDDREFAALHQRLWDDLKPVGVLEEILADQIVTTHWRLRRALKAESGEITLSVDARQWKRFKDDSVKLSWVDEPDPLRKSISDPVTRMKESASGNSILAAILERLRDKVEQEGQLSEAAVKSFNDHFSGIPNQLGKRLEEFRLKLQQNEDHLEPSALKEWALNFIDMRLETILEDKSKCEKRENLEEQARQAADALPPPEIVDKLLRYTKALEQQLFRAMNQLERLQRRRLGENVPPPRSPWRFPAVLNPVALKNVFFAKRTRF